jgi:uncharacterized repeat protein (TIGR02543 family)
MKRNYLILVVILVAVLTLTLSGCGRDEQSLDGLYIATFELMGGTLETPTSSVSTKINFAYNPGTYVLDPCELSGYKLFRTGYVFTGWYTDESCTASSKWDFGTLLNQEKLTLYAGWKKAVNITYSVCYVDEDGQTVTLGKYDVANGDKFEDWRNFAKIRANYTPLGYYSDPECTVEWDNSFTHPGNDTDCDVPVYVSYMQGKWTFVSTAAALRNAISLGENVYLTADIDCGGEILSLGDYSGEFNGNGFTVSNFKVTKKGTAIVSCAIFTSLGDGAIIRDVSFSGVIYDLSGVGSNISKLKVAALAVKVGSATVSGVSIEGTFVTNYTGTLLPTELSLYYETTASADVVENGNSVVVEIVND